MTREDIELYVTGNFDGDAAALERAIADDPALAAILADEARLELLLRDAAAIATFCVACGELVRESRCDSCGAAVRPGGYIVERVLVSNAHGRMYVAHDADGKQVALKELAFVHAPSAAAIAAFEREAKFLRALEHPAIPRFVASFEEGRGVHARYYLAQELVAGEALDHLEDHWYREDEIVALATQVLEILVYLQSLSPMVIHRDIKPANLLRRPDGSVALVDFGAAHVEGTTAGSTTVGTFGYMPIEQLAGVVDATTDVFALGATLLHLLTRQEPWKLAHTDVTINVSAPLRAFLAKLTAPDPKQRFASAKDALAGLPRRAALVVRPRRKVPRAAFIAAGAAALLASGGIGMVALMSRAPATVIQITDQADESDESEHAFEALPGGPMHIDVSFVGTSIHDAMRLLATECLRSIVVPDSIQLDIDVTLANVPCGEVIGMMLASHGLGYRFDTAANLIRVGPAQALQRENEAARERAHRRGHHWIANDVLPAGRKIDIDQSQGALRTVIDQIVASSGLQINVVIPDTIGARVTIVGKAIPWQVALQSVLASHGLWYRYSDKGHLLEIEPRKLLDAREDADREEKN